MGNTAPYGLLYIYLLNGYVFHVGDLGSNPDTDTPALKVLPPVGVLRQDTLTLPAYLGYKCKSLWLKASAKP